MKLSNNADMHNNEEAIALSLSHSLPSHFLRARQTKTNKSFRVLQRGPSAKPPRVELKSVPYLSITYHSTRVPWTHWS